VAPLAEEAANLRGPQPAKLVWNVPLNEPVAEIVWQPLFVSVDVERAANVPLPRIGSLVGMRVLIVGS
jgi:hypothetical protein